MTQRIRRTALALVAVLGLSLGAAGTAEASKKGRRNTAIGLGAVAAYGVIKKKPIIAGLAGGGALYSYTRSLQDDKRKRRVRTRRHAYCSKHRSRYCRH